MRQNPLKQLLLQCTNHVSLSPLTNLAGNKVKYLGI